MPQHASRRHFLRSASLAAAAVTLPFAETTSIAETPPEPATFRLFSADKLADAMKTLHAAPGNDNLFQNAALPFTVVLTTEAAKAAKEFEWHEGRDHIVQILDGSTLYELGGAPQSGRNTKIGEWLAPASIGATRLILKQGDMLIIPRGTPHKRTTEASVTFYLISTTGTVA